MAFSPAVNTEAIDGLVATLDHSEAANESSLAVDPLGEWATRTCVDVPPDVEEGTDEEEAEEDEDDLPRGDERVEGDGAGGIALDDDDHRQRNAVVTEQDNLWENGKTITYAFLGPAPLCGTPRQQNKVVKVLIDTPATWKDYANVKFKRLPSASASTAIVRIQFIEGTASWAHIGKRCKSVDPSKPTMNLGWIEDNRNLSNMDRGVVLHEFGHVLGLMHEHQSPAIGGVITLKEKYVREYFKKRRLSDKQIDEQILNPYRDSELTNYTEFDLDSVMIYFMPEAMNDQGIEIKPRDSLSKFDKAFMAVHYPFFGPNPPPRPDAHIENALRVLRIAPDEDEAGEGEALLPLDKVTPEPTEEEKVEMLRLAEERQKKLENKEQIMRLYRKGDWMGIREKVKEIYAGVREERMKVVAEMVRAMAKKRVAK